jgi:hypothetical protein
LHLYGLFQGMSMMEDHIRTGASAGQREHATDPLCGTRDQNGFSVQGLVHV